MHWSSHTLMMMRTDMTGNYLKLNACTYLHMVHGWLGGKRILMFSEAIPNDIIKDFEKLTELFYTGYELYKEARGAVKVKVLH